MVCKRENKIVDRMVAGTQFKSALKFFLHAILICVLSKHSKFATFSNDLLVHCMSSFCLQYVDETRTHNKFLAFTSKATFLLVKNKSSLILFTVYMCLHSKWTSSALTRICLPLDLDSSSLGPSWWYILAQCFPTQIWAVKLFYRCTLSSPFYSLWSIGHPWRASERCDFRLSPWPHSMIFLCFLFHPLLSFATFSSAYLFFCTPEDSNLMRFSLLLLLLYVLCVQSNSIFFFLSEFLLASVS